MQVLLCYVRTTFENDGGGLIYLHRNFANPGVVASKNSLPGEKPHLNPFIQSLYGRIPSHISVRQGRFEFDSSYSTSYSNGRPCNYKSDVPIVADIFVHRKQNSRRFLGGGVSGGLWNGRCLCN